MNLQICTHQLAKLYPHIAHTYRSLLTFKHWLCIHFLQLLFVHSIHSVINFAVVDKSSRQKKQHIHWWKSLHSVCHIRHRCYQVPFQNQKMVVVLLLLVISFASLQPNQSVLLLSLLSHLLSLSSTQPSVSSHAPVFSCLLLLFFSFLVCFSTKAASDSARVRTLAVGLLLLFVIDGSLRISLYLKINSVVYDKLQCSR